MHATAPSLIAAFTGLVEAGLGGVLLVTALRARRRVAHGASNAEESALLPAAIGATLLAVTLVSWPLLYATLSSLVPDVPSAFCMFGVTRLGRGADGLPGALPTLIATLQWTKPLVVFACGTWLVFARANRVSPTGALLGPTTLALAVAGLLALLDGGLELVYLAAPKFETPLSGGCCTVAFAALQNAASAATVPGDGSATLAATLAFASACAAALSVPALHPARSTRRPWVIAVLAAWAVTALLLFVPMLTDVVGPRVLRLPLHACGYCLIEQRPEMAAVFGLAALGSFAATWAAFVAITARRVVDADLDDSVRRLAGVAAFGLTGAVVGTVSALVVASMWAPPTGVLAS
jgi:hypothetical protein